MAGLNHSASVATPKVTIKTDKAARQKALNALIKGVQASGARIQSYLPVVLNGAIEANVWGWPRPTLRQNGSTAGGTRDIVDSGQLRDSLKVKTKFLKTKTTFNISYSAPYAKLVHDGGYILPYGQVGRDMKYLPPRPWITAALEGGVSGIEAIDLQAEFLTGVPSKW